MRRLSLPVLIFAGCFLVLGGIVFAATTSTVRTLPTMRAAGPATPPPLPLQTQSAGRARASGKTIDGHTFVKVTGLPPIRKVTLAQARGHLSGSRRRIASGTGATVTLIGDFAAYFTNGAPQITDFTMSYGDTVGFDCSNLAPNQSNLNWVIFPPDGSGYRSVTTTNTDASGNCTTNVQNVLLTTPYGAFPPNAPYAGVWAVALQRSNGQYEAVTYFVVTGEPAIATYKDGALSFPARDFTVGQTIYAVANGLNPSDAYAIGWVYTGATPNVCVQAVPNTFSADPSCFSAATGNPGVVASGGSFEAAWNTGAGSPSIGAYSILLYDITANHLVSTQQIVIGPSGAGAPVWSLVPYANAVTSGTNLGDTFATDGLLDQSVAGLGYSVTGMTTGRTYRLVVSDPNGAVLSSTAVNNTHPAAPPTFTGAGSAVSTGYVPFALNATKNTALGPSMTINANNTLTAQLYDTTSGTIAAAKTFTLLGYSASFGWNPGPAGFAGAGASCKAGLSSAGGSQNTVVITNTSDTTYGIGNGDGIVSIRINPGGGVSFCATPITDATATDSAGHTWNISTAGGFVTATIAQVQPTDALPVGGTLSFNIGLSAPSSTCSSACILPTQITPLHGVAMSAQGKVSNGLEVGGKNVTGTAIASTYAWAVVAPSPCCSITVPAAPSFDQLLYVDGTNGSTFANSYTLTATITNNSTSTKFNDVLFTFPAGYDFTLPWNAPTGLTVNGSSAGWKIVTYASSNNVPNVNSFAISCTNASLGSNCSSAINPGSAATVQFTLPMPNSSFALQPITSTANFDGGCTTQTSPKCTYTSTPLVSSGTTSTVAGPTNVDSTELGVYSLNVSKMSGIFSPQTIGAGVATTTTWTFTNTPTSSDPNPDYVNEINLTFPTGAVPTSITAPAGWTVSGSGTANVTVKTACVTTACGGTSPQDPYAIAPGGTLALTMTFNNPTTGTYSGSTNGIAWTVRGANGQTVTTSSGYSTLVVSPVAATVQFYGAGGYPTATTVPAGTTEPTVGSDANSTYGNAFDYRIANTGNQTINFFRVTVPWYTRSGLAGQDTGAPPQAWQVTATPTVTGCSTTPTVTYTNPSSGTAGYIDVTNCALAKGATADLLFDAKAPYLIGSDFDFPAAVCNNGTPPCTLSGSGSGSQTGVAGSPNPTGWEFMKIVADARLVIQYSTMTTPTIGSAPSLPNPTAGGSTPSTNCPGCSLFQVGANPGIDIGYISGTVTLTNPINASVISDVNNPDTWVLYATYSVSPTAPAWPGTFAMQVSSNTFVPAGNTLGSAPAVTTFFTPSQAGNGTTLATYGGNARRAPVDSIEDFRLAPNGDTTGRTITITYTLIVN